MLPVRFAEVVQLQERHLESFLLRHRRPCFADFELLTEEPTGGSL